MCNDWTGLKESSAISSSPETSFIMIFFFGNIQIQKKRAYAHFSEALSREVSLRLHPRHVSMG